MSRLYENWRGVKGVTMNYRGHWNDPQLIIRQGCFVCIANYYDIEDCMYEWCKEVHGIDKANDDDVFDSWCVEHRQEIVADIKQLGRWRMARHGIL